MSKFRKKPVIIEAWRTEKLMWCAKHSWSELPDAIKHAYDNGEIVFHGSGINVNTLEGTMLAGSDDWIICGVNGELYPCKSDIFQKSYELVE